MTNDERPTTNDQRPLDGGGRITDEHRTGVLHTPSMKHVELSKRPTTPDPRPLLQLSQAPEYSTMTELKSTVFQCSINLQYKEVLMRLVSLVALIGMVIWIVALQRRLRAAQMRGDMYRDISARLDRRLVELTEQER
jgi:hypothetical protein